MSSKKKTPDLIKPLEWFVGFLYGLLTWISVILLIVSVGFLINYFVSFLIRWDIHNPEFIQLCIYLIIGTFSLIFIYDNHCKKKIGCKN